MQKFNVLGVCGGNGVLLFPFKKRLVGNVEPRGCFHTKKEEQWKLNFGEYTPITKNLEPFEGMLIDIIMGSPSCGHSSVFRYSRSKKMGKPKEDKSLNLFLYSILLFKPKLFLLENLPKLLDNIPLEEWEEKFPNYHIICLQGSVSLWGNSQESRKRLVIIGVNKSLGDAYKFWSEIFPCSHYQKLIVSEIEKMANPKINFRNSPEKKVAMYDYRDPKKKNLTLRQVKKLWKGDFKNEFKWPIKSKKMWTLPGVYRNNPNKYPMTVRPADRQFNSKGKQLGLDEIRIIMGISPKFKVYMDSEKKDYWVNKGRISLTKGVVFEIGLWFKKCLQNYYHSLE